MKQKKRKDVYSTIKEIQLKYKVLVNFGNHFMAFKSLKTKQKLLESSENNIFSRFFQPFPTTI